MKLFFLKPSAWLLIFWALFWSTNVKSETTPSIILNQTGTLESTDIQLNDGAYLDAYPIKVDTNLPLFISAEAKDFNAFLLLLDESGKKVGESSYFYGGKPGILLESIKPGNYEIGITSTKSKQLGTYQLKAETISKARLLELQADFFFDQGRFFSQKGDKDSLLKAIESYENALPLMRKANIQIGEAVTLNNLGQIYSDLGEKTKALILFQQALPLLKIVGNQGIEATTLNNIGSVYSSLGDKNKALEYYIQSLLLQKRVGNQSGEVVTLNNIGNIYSYLGDKNKALEYYEKAMSLAKMLNDLNSKALILNNIGLLYSELGENQRALLYYQQALPLQKALGNRKLEATTLNNIGGVYLNLGDKQKALKYFQETLMLEKTIGDRNGEADTLNNIGAIYSDLGNKQKALEFYKLALSLTITLSYRSLEGTITNNIGLIYLDLGDQKKALEYFQKALVLQKTVGNNSGEATTLNNIGFMYSYLGDQHKALEYFKQALSLRRIVGDRNGEAITINNIGSAYLDLGDQKKALEYFKQALSLIRIVGDRNGEAITLYNMGFSMLKNKQYNSGSIYLNQSIELSESINSKDIEDKLKISFFDTYKNKYLYLQNSLIAEGKINSALEIAERGRARALVELLNQRLASNSEFIPTAKPMINELKTIAKTHNNTLITYSVIPQANASGKFVNTSLYIYLITPEGKVEFRNIDLTANEIKLPELIQAARQLVATPPLTKQDTSRGTNTTQYTIDNFRVGDYVKLQGEFPSDEPWQVVRLNREAQTLTLSQTLRESHLDNVSVSRIASKTNSSLQQLHKILIDPITELLPTDPNANIVVLPQGPLFGVPFPALQDAQGRYLIEKHTILTAPSIQVLSQTAQQNQRLARQPKNPDQALIVGNPYPYPHGLDSLDYATQEAQNIGELLGTRPLLGPAATEAKVRELMPQADILHFATHASFNEQQGLRSAIYLTAEPEAPDDDLFDTPGRITAEELFNQFERRPLNAKIAVLSACDTGRGEITGDGVIGLSRSLIAAGVPSVIVSLWSVNDQSTAQLMTEFYRQWQQQGVNKAKALRNAMLKTKAEYPDPYYWSAFTLIGEAD